MVMLYFNIMKRIIKELLMTFSQRKSLVSSKKVERFSFIAAAHIICLGTFIHMLLHDTASATEAVILITPLLIAAGFNMVQTEKEKQSNKEENGEV